MTPPRRFAAVVLDCDGVLVDSETISNRVFAEALATIGLNLSPDEIVATFVGRSLTQCVEIVTHRLGTPPPPEFVDGYRQRALAALAQEVRAVSGAVAALDALAARGLPVAVASSGSHEKMRVTLGASGLWPRLAGRCISTDDVASPKPAPDVYLAAAARLAAEPRSCLAVEDSPTGVRAAVAAGMTVLGYTGGRDGRPLKAAGATLCFTDMAEMPHWITLLERQLNAS